MPKEVALDQGPAREWDFRGGAEVGSVSGRKNGVSTSAVPTKDCATDVDQGTTWDACCHSRVPAGVPAVPLPAQLSAHAPGKAADDA